jgi:hypothetical protein
MTGALWWPTWQGGQGQQVHDRCHHRDVQAPKDHGKQQEGLADHDRHELSHLAVEDLGKS